MERFSSGEGKSREFGTRCWLAPRVEIPEQPRRGVVLRGINSPFITAYRTLLRAYRQGIASRAAAVWADAGFGMPVCVLAPVAQEHERNPWLSPSCQCLRGTIRTPSTSLCPLRPGQPRVLGVHLPWGSMNAALCAGLGRGSRAPSGMRRVGWKMSGWDLAGKRGCEDLGSSSAAPRAH